VQRTCLRAGLPLLIPMLLRGNAYVSKHISRYGFPRRSMGTRKHESLLQCFWLRLSLQVAVMLAVGSAQAGLSGRFETLIVQDNRQIQSTNRIEERLDLAYVDPALGWRSDLTLAFVQRQDGTEASLYQFYFEKALNNEGSLLTLGRLQRADAFGLYTLDGLLFKLVDDRTTLTLYGGVPSRIEGFRSIEGKALYGFDLQMSATKLGPYAHEGRFGWQHFEGNYADDHDRLNVGWRSVHQQQAQPFYPSAFSLTGSYLVDDKSWESVQLSAYRDFEHAARLRVDYETYLPGEDEITFKDRFYSRYAHGRQSQFKAGYQFNFGGHYTGSFSGRRVVREFGNEGYGAVARVDYRSKQGWRLRTQLDRLALADEQVNGLYLEAEKSLSPWLRGTLGGVLQQQQKWLVGDNRTAGIEVRLERRIKLKRLPSAFWFSTHASYIHNSRLTNEYRIAVRMSYSFDDRTRELF